MNIALLTELQQDLIESLSQHGSILILLGPTPEQHLFFTYTLFMGANHSNIGSVETNYVKGINITKLVKNLQGGALSQQPQALLSQFASFVDTAQVVSVKYANLPFLIYGDAKTG